MLGEVREVQVNLQILERWRAQQKGDACALEYLIRQQKLLMEQNRSAVIKKLRHNKFNKYDKFLAKLKGSTKMPSTKAILLETRKSDFLSFEWPSRVSNVQLHNLRIRTKKFRYAVEIADTLTSKKFSPTVKKLKKLQDVLGAVQDLSMVMALTRREQEEWRRMEFQVIPSALGKVYRVGRAERAELLPKIQEKYNQVFGSKPVHSMPVKSAEPARVAAAPDLMQVG
jgi:CHAD domain-containing protein